MLYALPIARTLKGEEPEMTDKKITDEQLFEKLAEVQRSYERSLDAALLGATTYSRIHCQEPARNIFYPLDLTLNENAVYALVE